MGLACGACLPSLAGCLQDSGKDEAPAQPDTVPTFHSVEVPLDLGDPRYAILNNADGALRTVVKAENSEFTVILARPSDRNILAFSASCPHAGCTVDVPSGPEIRCPCHGSRFSLDGNVLQGPASSPLSTIPLIVDGNKAVLRFRLLNI